jgi:uncharacterized membrane protein
MFPPRRSVRYVHGLATFDLWQKTDSVNAAYRVVRGNLIPAMIFVMLLRCDIRKILKLGPRMLIGFFSATITIMIGFVVMFALMKNGFPPEAWKTWGALAGSWIGGTANMVAIQGALGIEESAMGYTLLVDNVNYSIWVIMLLATVPYARFFNKWTRTDTSTIDSVGSSLEVKKTPERRWRRRISPFSSEPAFSFRPSPPGWRPLFRPCSWMSSARVTSSPSVPSPSSLPPSSALSAP